MYRDWGACGETLERKLQRIIFGMLRVHSRSPQCQHFDPVALSESVVLFSSFNMDYIFPITVPLSTLRYKQRQRSQHNEILSKKSLSNQI